MPDKDNEELRIGLAEDRVAKMTTFEYIIWKAKLIKRTITLMLLFLPSLILSPLLYIYPDVWC